MSKKVKCPICGELNNKEDTIEHNKRYYCEECYEETKANSDYWRELIHYICSSFHIDKPTGKVLQQIKTYKNDPYNFTNKGIYMTLKYYYEVLGNNILNIDEPSIGIVPYYYNATKRYCINIDDLEEEVDNLNIDDFNAIPRIIKTKNRIQNSNIKKELKYEIDWSDTEIDYGEDEK